MQGDKLSNQTGFGFFDDVSTKAEREPQQTLTLVTPTSQVATLFGDVVPVERLRAKPRSIFKGMQLNAHELSFRSLALATLAAEKRPQRRADCLPGGCNEQRPCPWVSCHHHLAIDVNEEGSIKLNFPSVVAIDGKEFLTTDIVDWDAMEHTCSLDAAEDGGWFHRQVADALNVVEGAIDNLEARLYPALRNEADIRGMK